MVTRIKEVSAVAVGDEVQLQIWFDDTLTALLFLTSKESAAALRDQITAIVGESRRG
jgi:hypothetical protein